MRITPSKIEFGVISAVITVFIIPELSDCTKVLRIRPLRLNVGTISVVYLSIIMIMIMGKGMACIPDHCSNYTKIKFEFVLLEYFNLLIM